MERQIFEFTCPICWHTKDKHSAYHCAECDKECPCGESNFIGPGGTDAERLQQWGVLWRDLYRFERWHDPAIKDAIMAYTLRSLGRRRRVPNVLLVYEVLAGKRDVPMCGYIDCFWDELHCH